MIKKQQTSAISSDSGTVLIEAIIAIPLLFLAIYAFLMLGILMIQVAETNSLALRTMLNYYSTPANSAVTQNEIRKMVIHPNPVVASEIANHIVSSSAYIDPLDPTHIHLLNLLSGEVSRGPGSNFMQDHVRPNRGWVTHLDVNSNTVATNRVRVTLFNDALTQLRPYAEIVVQRDR